MKLFRLLCTSILCISALNASEKTYKDFTPEQYLAALPHSEKLAALIEQHIAYKQTEYPETSSSRHVDRSLKVAEFYNLTDQIKRLQPYISSQEDTAQALLIRIWTIGSAMPRDKRPPEFMEFEKSVTPLLERHLPAGALTRIFNQ